MSLHAQIENWLSSADKRLFGGKTVEIESPVNLDQSVARLQAVTQGAIRAPWAKEAIAGQVQPNWICLYHVKPWQGRNSFRTVLLGSFQQRDGKVVLQGYYSIHPFVKVFLAIWMGMLTMFALAWTAGIIIEGKWDQAWVLLVFVGMGLMVCLMVFFGKSISSKDESWIEQKIAQALQQDEMASAIDD